MRNGLVQASKNSGWPGSFHDVSLLWELLIHSDYLGRAPPERVPKAFAFDRPNLSTAIRQTVGTFVGTPRTSERISPHLKETSHNKLTSRA